MITPDPDYPTFTARIGERNLIQVDFGPSLAENDHLVGAPSVSSATLSGPNVAGSLTVSNIALAAGDAPEAISFLVETLTGNVRYRLDCACDTQNGERKVVPVILVVAV